MIRTLSSADQTEHTIVFSPRPGTSLGAKEIRRRLVYSCRCPYCRNVILAAFLTESKVPLKKYEETNVMNGLGQFHLHIPSEQTPIETAYHSEFTPIPGKKLGLQRIYIMNHVIPENLLGRSTAAKEHTTAHHGPRVCPYTGVFTPRRDLLMKDAMLMGGFPERELQEYNLPSWEQFLGIVEKCNHHFLLDTVGNVPPMVMCRSDLVEDRKGLAIWRGHLFDYKKPKQDDRLEEIAAQPQESEEEEDPYTEELRECPNGCFTGHRTTCPGCGQDTVWSGWDDEDEDDGDLSDSEAAVSAIPE